MRGPGWLLGLGLLIGVAQAAAPKPGLSAPAARAAPSASEAAALKAYQDAFFHAHLHALGAYLAGYLPQALPAGVPVHRIEVLRTSLGFALVTSGLGMQLQSAPDAPPRVELVAYAPREGPQLADLLSLVGQRLFGSDRGSAARAWGTVTLSRTWYGFRRFLLVPAGEPVEIGGRPVTVFEVVPLSEHELRAVRRPGEAQDWIVRHPLPERSQRWVSALPHGRR